MRIATGRKISKHKSLVPIINRLGQIEYITKHEFKARKLGKRYVYCDMSNTAKIYYCANPDLYTTKLFSSDMDFMIMPIDPTIKDGMIIFVTDIKEAKIFKPIEYLMRGIFCMSLKDCKYVECSEFLNYLGESNNNAKEK